MSEGAAMAGDRAPDPAPAVCTKVDIVARLAALNGYRDYLEICTPSTGLFYADVDRSRFDVCHRLMYRCPADFTDGMEIDFRSADLDIGECLRRIREAHFRYDIVLVDPYHDYDPSLRDLREAFALIREGGMLVVHDCLPPTEASANPDGVWDPVAGGWAGLTHRAYVDFVTGRRDLTHYTVDTDWGCGVIRKLGGANESKGNGPPPSRTRARRDGDPSVPMIERWQAIGGDHGLAYRFLREHRHALLNLITVDEFLAGDPNHPGGGASERAVG